MGKKKVNIVILSTIIVLTTIIFSIVGVVIYQFTKNKQQNELPEETVNALDISDLATGDWVSFINNGYFYNYYASNSFFYISSVTDYKFFCYATSVGIRLMQTVELTTGNLNTIMTYYNYSFDGKYVYLEKDIDFSSTSYTMEEAGNSDEYLSASYISVIDGAGCFHNSLTMWNFLGTFDGRGYSLKNANWTLNKGTNGVLSYGLGGIIENVCLENFKLTVSKDGVSGTTYLGVLTDSIVDGGEIRGCMIDNIHILSNRYRADTYVSYFANEIKNGGILKDCVITGNVYNDGIDKNGILNDDGMNVYNFYRVNSGSNNVDNLVFLSDFKQSPDYSLNAEMITTNSQATDTKYKDVSTNDYWESIGDFKYLSAFASMSTILVDAGSGFVEKQYPSSLKHSTNSGYTVGVWVDGESLCSAGWTIIPEEITCGEFDEWYLADNFAWANVNYTYFDVTIVFKACASAGVKTDVSVTVDCGTEIIVTTENYFNGQIKSITYKIGDKTVTYNTEGTMYIISSSTVSENETRHSHNTNNPIVIELDFKTYSSVFK